jgi:hypothetical protein
LPVAANAAGADLTGRYLDGENNVAPAPAFIVTQWIASAYGRDAEALSYLYGYRKRITSARPTWFSLLIARRSEHRSIDHRLKAVRTTSRRWRDERAGSSSLPFLVATVL